MKKTFNSIYELNNYANKNPNNIANIDEESFVLTYKGDKTTYSVTEPTTKIVSIIFNTIEDYELYKSKNKKTIQVELESIKSLITKISLDEFSNLRETYDIEYIEIIDEHNHYTPTETIIDGVSYSDETNWAIPYANIQEAWDRGFTGKGVKIGVIDTMHVPNLKNVPLKKVVNMMGHNWEYGSSSHGTRVASIICSPFNNEASAGIAYGADVYGLETANKYGSEISISTTAINQSYEYSIKNRIDIINLSYSSKSKSTTEEKHLNKYEEMGGIAVAAGGNGGDNQIVYPAAYDSVLSVGSVMKTSGGLSTYFSASNNSKLDYMFSGVGVEGTTFDGTFEKQWGTSFSSPGIAAFIALLMEEYPDRSKNGIIQLLDRELFEITDETVGKFPIYSTKVPPKDIGPFNKKTWKEIDKAIPKIDSYLDKNQYKYNKEELETVIKNGIKLVENSQTTLEVENNLLDVYANLDQIISDSQYDYEEVVVGNLTSQGVLYFKDLEEGNNTVGFSKDTKLYVNEIDEINKPSTAEISIDKNGILYLEEYREVE